MDQRVREPPGRSSSAQLKAKPSALMRAEKAFLTRVLDGRIFSAPAVGIAAHLHRSEGLGELAADGRLVYPPAALAQAKRALLKRTLATEVPRSPKSRGNRASAPRRWEGIREGLVAGVTLGSWGSPPVACDYLAMDVHELADAPVEVWIVCDQLWQLRVVQGLDWLRSDIQGLRAMAIHRGAHQSRFKHEAVQALLMRTTAPVWAYGDLTVKPLLRAAALPRLDKVCLPPMLPMAPAAPEPGRWSMPQQDVRDWTSEIEATGCSVVVEAWWRIAEQSLNYPVVDE